MVIALQGGAFALPFSGQVESTFEFFSFNPTYGDHLVLTDFTFSITVAYPVNGWEFGLTPTFSKDAFEELELFAFGRLGGFTIDSTVLFDPHVAVDVFYTLPCGTTCLQTQSVTGVTSGGAAATWTQSIWNCPTLVQTASYRPAFSSLEATAQTFMWGLNLEGLFYLKGDDTEPKTVTGKWVSGNPFAFCGVPPCVWTLIQTLSHTVTPCLPRYGAGWKYTASGMFCDILLTSRTYINLEEYTYNELMAKDYAKTYLADTLKMGGVYYLPEVGGETCCPCLTRNYTTFEGLSLGCLDIDAGMSFDCSAGFEWLKILLTDIEISPSLSFDALLEFGTSQTGSYKLLTIEPKLQLGPACCLTFHLDLDSNPAYFLDALKINGMSMSHTWNGVTFSSLTSFNPVYESLGGFYLADDVVSPITYGFFAPDTIFPKTTFNTATGEGYYTLVCFPEEYYDIWEMFILAGHGDGCCGGTYEWEIKTYFGDRWLMIVDSFWFWYKDEDGNSYQYNPGTPATRTEPVVRGSAPPYCEDDAVTYGVGYYNAPGDTFFGWVKTDANLTLPLWANFSLSFSAAFDVYGLGELEFGVSFTW